MAFFDVLVDETRHYIMRYRVEADNAKQALSEAERGVSYSETEVKCNGVLERGVSLCDVTPVPVFIAVEYDLKYYGGDYSGYGEEALMPIEGLTDENLKERFREQTGHDPVHIVHYSFDEPVDANGEWMG